MSHRIALCLAVAVLVAGCETAAPPSAPLPPSVVAPDVRGLWSGAWSGTPVTLLIADQLDDAAGPSGLYVGPFEVLGQRAPGVSGVLTSDGPRGPVSAAARGWFGASGGRMMLVVVAATIDGRQILRLTLLDPARMAGVGESEFYWGPQGSVTLTKTPR